MTASVAFETSRFALRLAKTDEDLRAAQNLRYDVFIEELGGQGAGVDHSARTEADAFDPHADHVLLYDTEADILAGSYRVMRSEHAIAGPGFYSESEFDLSPLLASGKEILELGRSCVRAEYRGGAAMWHLWAGVARYVKLYRSEILFGVASLHGAKPERHAEQLSLLHHRHQAPQHLSPRSRQYQTMNLIAPKNIDRRAAMVSMPSLIKAYLRLGGQIGDGAFVDYDFNCVDVMMIMDTARLNDGPARRLTEAMQ